MTNEHIEIVMAVFDGENRAKEVLAAIDEISTAEVGVLRDYLAVISLDDQGKLSVSRPKKQTRQSILGGTLVGALVGTTLGLPVIGTVLGGVAGAWRATNKKKSDQEFSLDRLTELMTPDSSVIVAEVEDWRVESVISNLEMRGAKLVLHTNEAELAQADAADEESLDREA